MILDSDLSEYMAEVRKQVCVHCVERPPGGPPCAPLGKRCGVELHLGAVVNIVHSVHSGEIEPYLERFHGDVCSTCANKTTSQCPCALDYLLTLAVRAIETVDQRRAEGETTP